MPDLSGAPADADRLQRWQQRLAAEGRLFDPLAPGSRIGLISESVLDRSAPRADRMLVWERESAGMRVGFQDYPGFDRVDVDLLIALDPTAAEALEDSPAANWLRATRRLLRDGHLLFFARKPRPLLEEAGYDDLLHQLGFAYLGACR